VVAIVLLGAVTPAMAAQRVIGVGCGDVAELAAAIDAANANGGATTIDLPPCTYTLTAPDPASDSVGPDGLPPVTAAVTVHGYGATIERSDSAPQFRIIHVLQGGSLTLNGVTVTGGDSATLGGGILNDGALRLAFSAVEGNVSDGGGGGIGSRPGSSLTVVASSVSDNATPGANDGGAIATGGAVSISGSVIAGNTAGGAGGAIESFGTLAVSGSAFVGNSAPIGGALFDQSTATMTRAMLTGNHADDRGGAVYVDEGSSLTLAHSVVHRNSAGTDGGGIFNNSGAVTLTHSPVVGNAPDNCAPAGSVAGCS
jgi:hypothetical protein